MMFSLKDQATKLTDDNVLDWLVDMHTRIDELEIAQSKRNNNRKSIDSLLRRRLYGYNGDNWICYFYFVSWYAISLGIHFWVDPEEINAELHMPFGFIRMGHRRNKPV